MSIIFNSIGRQNDLAINLVSGIVRRISKDWRRCLPETINVMVVDRPFSQLDGMTELALKYRADQSDPFDIIKP